MIFGKILRNSTNLHYPSDLASGRFGATVLDGETNNISEWHRPPGLRQQVPGPYGRATPTHGTRCTVTQARSHPLAISKLLISFLIFHISTFRSEVVSSPLVVIVCTWGKWRHERKITRAQPRD